MRAERLVGDVASFYLPYAGEILASRANVKIVCLKRDRNQTIASFIRWLNHTQRWITNHWIAEPPEGSYHDPLRSRLFPKFDVSNRDEAIGLYWDDYYQRANLLAQNYPDRFRIFDASQTLDSLEGQQELLSYCGIESEWRFLETDIGDRSDANSSSTEPRSRSARDIDDPRRCVVLTPYTGSIVAGCEEGLRELEHRGCTVRRVSGIRGNRSRSKSDGNRRTGSGI